MKTETAAQHPALDVIDREIASHKAEECEHQRIAAEHGKRAVELGQLRARIEKTLDAPAPKANGERKPRARRRGKAEMDAARATLAAAEGLVGIPMIETNRTVAADSADPLEIPAGLRR